MEDHNDSLKSLKIAREEFLSLADFYPNELNYIFDIADLLDRKSVSETDSAKEEE